MNGDKAEAEAVDRLAWEEDQRSPSRVAASLSLRGDIAAIARELHDLEPELARMPARERLLTRASRRTIDIAVSASALLVLSPVIGVAAFVVRLDSRGRAFFRQIRVGRGGRPFEILKLRGMYVDARERFPDLYDYTYSTDEAQEIHFHAPDDPRVTRAGRVFRKSSIDELPNFWNVLVGDMSLVGPRPQIPEMFQYYGPYEDVVLSVRPGIFSLPKAWLRDQLPLRETVVLDAYYVHHRTLLLDLKIIMRGIATVCSRRGVH